MRLDTCYLDDSVFDVGVLNNAHFEYGAGLQYTIEHMKGPTEGSGNPSTSNFFTLSIAPLKHNANDSGTCVSAL